VKKTKKAVVTHGDFNMSLSNTILWKLRIKFRIAQKLDADQVNPKGRGCISNCRSRPGAICIQKTIRGAAPYKNGGPKAAVWVLVNTIPWCEIRFAHELITITGGAVYWGIYLP
jgi:hypothetical protein